MPDLDFKIIGVEPAVHGLTPLLHFKLQVSNVPTDGDHSDRDTARADSVSVRTARL